MRTCIVSFAVGFQLLLGAEASPMPQEPVAKPCSNNNCLRAVRADSFPNRPTAADCSSFLLKTVTPAFHTETAWVTITPVTETATSISTEVQTELVTETVIQTVDVATETVTVTETEPAAILAGKRQVTIHPSAIPTYASACKSVEAYSSACSCIGIRPSTSTAPTPTTTVTSTSTATAQTTLRVVQTVTTTELATVTDIEPRTATTTTTATITLLPIPQTFNLRASGDHPEVEGRFLARHTDPFSGSEYVLSTTPYPFAIDAEGALYRTGRPDARMCAPVYNPTQDYPYALWELTDAMSLVYNWPKVLPCAVSPVDLELTCARGDPTVSAWFMCIPSSNTNTFLVLGKPKGPDNQTWCTPIKLYAEPV